ncbi:MAG: cytidylate kinase family protein [Nanoarchaeota archaeon]
MPKTFIKFLEPYENGLVKKGPIIAVSGFIGVGKTTAAKMLKDILGYRYYYPPTFRGKAMRKRQLLTETIEEANTEEFYEIDIKALKNSMKGKIVVDSRLSAWALGKWADIRIFVNSEPDIRIHRFAKGNNLTVEQAADELREREKFELSEWRKLYNIDFMDKRVYTHVIDNNDSKNDLKNKLRKIVKKL